MWFIVINYYFISVVRRLEISCDFPFLSFIPSLLLPDTTIWPRINKQPWVFFLVTCDFCWVMNCHLQFQFSSFCENHLHSHQAEKTLQYIFFPYNLISSDLIHYQQILFLSSLEIIEKYFFHRSIFFRSPTGSPCIQENPVWPALGKPKRWIFMFPVLLRPLQNSQMDLLVWKGNHLIVMSNNN